MLSILFLFYLLLSTTQKEKGNEKKEKHLKNVYTMEAIQ